MSVQPHGMRTWRFSWRFRRVHRAFDLPVILTQLEEQLVRLDALYEYAVMHGEDDQAESIRRRMNKLTENV